MYSDCMTGRGSSFPSQLRHELGLHNRQHARGHAHVESYGSPPVIVYAPEEGRHGNFFDAAYKAILSQPDWMRRFDKVHAQGRSLPKAERRWRELDSSMSSDALLMNIFCTPGIVQSLPVRQMLGLEGAETPVFGWKARVPLSSGRFDRTEADMRLGSLLVEAKLTEGGFQVKDAVVVHAYRDFDEVFERDLLPRVELAQARRKESTEFPEDYSQEFELVPTTSASVSRLPPQHSIQRHHAGATQGLAAYTEYQLIRNVLAAYAEGSSFCVMHDERRPDLREAWFRVMAAVKSAEMRVRLKVVTWQELAAVLPARLQEFLHGKYGIVAPLKIHRGSGYSPPPDM
jgi:hypothetical protein